MGAPANWVGRRVTSWREGDLVPDNLVCDMVALRA
jgi:hypothetical protein